MQIRQYQAGDQEEWVRMRHQLWPEKALPQHVQEMRTALSRTRDVAVLVCPRTDGKLAGFVEIQVRPSAPGSSTTPICRVDAWFVDTDVRRSGIGRALLVAAEHWALGNGCQEIISWTDAGALELRKAHQSVGFEEAGYSVLFRKSLNVF